jgi:hypothetical protein
MFAPRNPLAACLIPVLSLVAGALLAQPAGEAAAMPQGTLEGIKVHGPSLEGNLVTYIDEHYRTIAERESRGLGGHSTRRSRV